MKKVVLTLTFGLFLTSFLMGQGDTTYQQTLRKWFKTSGQEESLKTGIPRVFEEYRTDFPDIEDERWEQLTNEFINITINRYVEMTVPIYKKYFTISDLEGLISFFETPLGIKYAKSGSMMNDEEYYQIVSEWSVNMELEFEKLLEEEGLK